MAKRAIEVGDTIWLRAAVVSMTWDGGQIVVKLPNYRMDGIPDENVEKPKSSRLRDGAD